MIFCESYFLKELPYDPNLPYVFVGEEILHSIRFYTHGWDVFTPKENVIFHEYTRSDKPKIWNDNPEYSDIDAYNKIKYIIGLDVNKNNVKNEMLNDIELYGLGKIRSLDDYYKLSKIDIKKRKVYSNFCREGNIGSLQDIIDSNEIKNSEIEGSEIEGSEIEGLQLFYYILIIIIVTILIISLIIVVVKG